MSTVRAFASNVSCIAPSHSYSLERIEPESDVDDACEVKKGTKQQIKGSEQRLSLACIPTWPQPSLRAMRTSRTRTSQSARTGTRLSTNRVCLPRHSRQRRASHKTSSRRVPTGKEAARVPEHILDRRWCSHNMPSPSCLPQGGIPRSGSRRRTRSVSARALSGVTSTALTPALVPMTRDDNLLVQE